MTARAPLTSRQKLALQRAPAFGAWTSLSHPSITEMLAASGVHFVGIDLEHSAIGLEPAQQIIVAAQASGAACLPRVASHNGEQIRRLLDAGADGVIVPDVSTPAQVEHIIQWCKYPPLGRRSFGVARAQQYGMAFDRYVATWNTESTILIQIESIQAVQKIDDLLAFPAVDGVMVGPYDLSGSLGIPGQLEHARVTDACAQVIAACQRRQKACGTQLVDPTLGSVEAALRSGYTFVVLASDVFILWKWAERMRALIGACHGTMAQR